MKKLNYLLVLLALTLSACGTTPSAKFAVCESGPKPVQCMQERQEAADVTDGQFVTFYKNHLESMNVYKEVKLDKACLIKYINLCSPPD